MNVAIIGNGNIGREIKRMHPDAVMHGRNHLMDYTPFDVVIDTAWSGSRSKADRNDRPTQATSYWQARMRIMSAKPAHVLNPPRYIMLGTQDEWPHGSIIPEARGIYSRAKTPYGVEKCGACKYLAETIPNYLWIRLSGVVHKDLPDDTIFPLAARSDALAYDPEAIWNCLPLDVAAEAIYQMALSDLQGVVNLGSGEYRLGDLVKAVNPELEVLPGGRSYSVQMVVEKAKPYIADHDIFAVLRKLGGKWRKQNGKT